jgi:hypothetical protein
MLRLTPALFALAIGMAAEQPNRKTFDFKGDSLGETFDQFSSRHKGFACSGDADLLAGHGLHDWYEEQRRTYHNAPEITHTFYCFLQWPIPTLAGAETSDNEYTFFEDKLYKINVTVNRYGNAGVSDAYRSIEDAYTDRFGQPREKAENAHDKHLIWLDPDHPYSLAVVTVGDQTIVTVVFMNADADEAIKKLRPKRSGDT